MFTIGIYDLDIPAAESDDPKEVLAFFGLAAMRGQMLETELVQLIVAARVVDEPESGSWIDTLLDQHFAHTLGRLIRISKVHASFAAESEAVLNDALARRNRLIHHYFRETAETFATALGRRAMIKELQDDVALFHRAMTTVAPIRQALFRELGAEDAGA